MCVAPSLRLPALALAVMLGWAASAAAQSPGNTAGTLVPGKTASDAAADRQQRLHQLVEQLGDPDYFTRERAQAALAKAGFEAFDALTAAATHADLEVASRARYLLGLIRVDWTRAEDPPEVRELLANYEYLSVGDRLQRIERLAALPDRAGLPALCRFVRFESSPLMSKHAAVAILTAGPADEPVDETTASLLREQLGGSEQPAARWLMAYTEFRDDPALAVESWGQLVRDEQRVLRNAPGQSSTEVVSPLIRFQINWLDKLQRREETVAAMKQLVALENGDPETLLELIDWLAEQKAWEPIDELADRFAVRLASNPILLYALADAYLQRGDEKKADEYAAQAMALNPGNQRDDLYRHLLTAYALRQRGLLPWAEREFQYTADNGEATDELTIYARTGLAEMLHDRGDHLQAAESLRKLIEQYDPKSPNETEVGTNTLGELRARHHYFHACQWKEKGDATRHRAELEKALEAYPGEIDVLIACWHLPDVSAEFRDRVGGLIDESAAVIREQIANDPSEAIPYNQLAWLLGNTKGDFDEAIQLSRRSLELDPENGGYYDTLAHCYHSKKDYASAVKYQRKAAELEPHSGMIARKLAFFEKALAEHPDQRAQAQ